MSDAGNPMFNKANSIHVPGARRAPVFAAMGAARAMLKRFLANRRRLASSPFGSRPARTPLLLRWARKAAAGWSSGTARSTSLPARPSCHFHWHFHLASTRGSDRERREARTTAPAGPLQTLAWIPQAASVGRFALLARSARPEASRASPALREEGTSDKFRWSAQAAAQARSVRAAVDSRAAQRPHALAGQRFLVRVDVRPGARAFGQRRAAGLGRGREKSPWIVPRSPRAPNAAMASARRSPHAPVRSGPKDVLRPVRSQLAPTLQWEKGEHPVARPSDSTRPPAAGRRPGKQDWRARDRAASATESRKRTSAPGTLASIAMRRPMDLVWPAGSGSSALAGDLTRFRNSAVTGTASAQSMPAISQAPAASSPTRGNTVARAPALDPVLANRLADEVMRRIDHRARIERERRGL